MQNEHMDFRKFKGGSWDLRKTDRRQRLLSIAFPERRRANDRRHVGQMATALEKSMAADMLQWVSKSGLDE